MRLIAVAAALLLAGCGGSSGCSDEMDEFIGHVGQPEEVNEYDEHNFHSHTWWYWSRGFSRTFTWGNGVTGCDVGDYTFTPIR